MPPPSHTAAHDGRPDQPSVLIVGGGPSGLFCAGEMVGGLFYFNYPSGTGLVSGSLFGRLAGDGAGRQAMA
jgi:tricarballylate dehydrogenase